MLGGPHMLHAQVHSGDKRTRLSIVTASSGGTHILKLLGE